MRKFVIASISILLVGCSSSIISLTDRGVMSDHLTEPHDRMKVKSMTGDRRLVYFLERPNTTVEGHARSNAANPNELGHIIICAEPFAGGMSTRGGRSSLSVTGKAAVGDEVSSALLAIDGRAAAVRLFEDASHELCKRYQDGTIKPEQYTLLLSAAIADAFGALQTQGDAATESAKAAAAIKTSFAVDKPSSEVAAAPASPKQ